jgi:hypothetical protein
LSKVNAELRHAQQTTGNHQEIHQNTSLEFIRKGCQEPGFFVLLFPEEKWQRDIDYEGDCIMLISTERMLWVFNSQHTMTSAECLLHSTRH